MTQQQWIMVGAGAVALLLLVRSRGASAPTSEVHDLEVFRDIFDDPASFGGESFGDDGRVGSSDDFDSEGFPIDARGNRL